MIISSISYKGGVGKSTVAQNLAVCFANSGYKVCIIDADETQASIKWSGIRFEKEVEPTIQTIGMCDSKAFIGSVKKQYEDYEIILIDCPPSLSPIASKAMLISHLLIIPVTPTGGSDIWVTEDFLERYNDIQEQKEIRTPAHILINKFEPNLNLHKAYIGVIEQLIEDFDIGLLKTKLHKRTAYGESNARGKAVYEYDNDKAKDEVGNLAKEILSLMENV
jgi:chromosome partitioning protein